MVIKNKIRSLAVVTMVVLGSGMPGSAQVTTPVASQQDSETAPKGRKPTTTVRPGTVKVENRVTAPQVVTIVHRLSGIKMFRLILRSNKDVKAISKLNEAFNITDEVHTNVIAGLSLEDGQTIVAWLPDAELEIGPLAIPFAPPAAGASTQRTMPPLPQWALPGAGSFVERPDMTVIARDGQRLAARYVGLDGGTGLSILKLVDQKISLAADANEQAVGIGQHLRLFGPEQVAQSESPGGNTIFARVGETEGRVVGISRAPSGAIARVKIRSGKLSAVHIGSVVLNDAGETVGIIDTIDSNEATMMPGSLVRNAARRVLKRQSSVPRPWLGISGEPIEDLQFEQILRRGWHSEGAKSLTEARRGIMLTSVTPGSPAARAALRSGDVILSVNHEDIKSSDDLSWLLEEAEPGAAVQFTVARPNKPTPEAVKLTLSEFPNQFYGLKGFDIQPQKVTTQVEQFFKPGTVPGSLISSSLLSQGIETVGLLPPVASQFGANGGLLVLAVHPATAAFKAGLRTGDVIEMIDGREVSSPAVTNAFSSKPGASYSFSVVRNKERIVVKVEATDPR
ncbi:MAG TPA: PDZ domain-containing protein [Pyrinomonadaceae bacterium]|nr:PDZ domain-containing protein [Pyrinomonadaceae bacterium]